MNKKYLSVVLFGALLAASAGTFTSCKDYDDDIKGLQEQIDKSGSTITDLQTQLTTLKAAADAAQATADAAKTAAAEAKTAADAAKAAGDQAKADAATALAAAKAAEAAAVRRTDRRARLRDRQGGAATAAGHLPYRAHDRAHCDAQLRPRPDGAQGDSVPLRQGDEPGDQRTPGADLAD